MIDFTVEIPVGSNSRMILDLFIEKPPLPLHISNDGIEFLAWGDPIISEGFSQKLSFDPVPGIVVKNLAGHFYYLLKDKKRDIIYMGNSLFSILPVYIYESKNKIFISNRVESISRYIEYVSISRRFVLETILFNYPLFNHSFIEGIQLLPANSNIKVSARNWSISKHTFIADLLTAAPSNWRKSVHQIRDVFLSSVQKYLPDQHYMSALTGGFDSRTLVSAGIYFHRDFSCYTFGSPESADTKIAGSLCKQAKLTHIKIDLDDQYARMHSLDSGLEFVRYASALGSFARAHYQYSIKQLQGEAEYILTGNFGSEVFRSAHNFGVVISPNLYLLFNSPSIDQFIESIENSPELLYLNRADFLPEWEGLKEDLPLLPSFDPLYNGFSKNQKFYVFVFEEIFRKYFGAEMVNQFRYLKNRTPYLDLTFLAAVFKTELAGVHADFFEHNPLKRFKGQLVYAHIINKCYPAFGKILTNKGYRPSDLLSFPGKLNILVKYMNKKFTKPSIDQDPDAVSNAYRTNRLFYQNISINPDLFDPVKTGHDIMHAPNEILYKVLSISYLAEELIPATQKPTQSHE
jgi:hypothetical protein